MLDVTMSAVDARPTHVQPEVKYAKGRCVSTQAL
jgi:hypothetical protein